MQSASGRLLGLDGLRALAVFAVVYQHFGPLGWVHSAVAPGTLGVHLFFVLSGFLITGILLQTRGVAGTFGVFYLRRQLRIMPVYYLVLALAWLAVPSLHASWPWHASYLSNVYFALRGDFEGPISHLWSLSVEQQFYLLWPWFVVVPPRPTVPWAIAATFVVAIVSRWVLLRQGMGLVGISVLLPTVIDSLGAGAWLAWRRAEGQGPVPGWLALLAGAGLVAAIAARTADIAWQIQIALGSTATALLSAWLVDRAAVGRGWWQRLQAGPLVYVGTVSYSIYLLHFLVPSFFAVVHPATAKWLAGRGVAQWLAVSTISVGLASLSWYGFERPINNLKRYIAYRERPARSVAVP